MKVSHSANINFSNVDTLIIPIFEDKNLDIASYGEVFQSVADLLPNLKKSEVFTGKKNSNFVFTFGEKFPTIIALGLGKLKDCNLEVYRQVGGYAAGVLKNNHAVKLGIFSYSDNIDSASLLEGIILGAYSFEKYKTTSTYINFKSCKVFTNKKGIKKSLSVAEVMANATNFARDLSNSPGSEMTPSILVKEARKIATQNKVKISVLNEAKMSALGMNALLAVSKGSKEPAYLMSLFYKSSSSHPTIVLVGKGVTFDSGGISLKPSAKMNEMKFDMCGAAAVLGSFKAICALKPKVNVICVVPTSENMPGGGAVHPGDIVKAYNGKTIEIDNTDAEGRLILSDALAYSVKKYKPDVIVDVATLTGACITSLGHIAAGIMTNDDDLADKLQNSADATGEKIWRLPIWQEYSDMVKGTYADLCNIGAAGQAGTITGGCFIKEFVNDTPWAHIDIAGMAWGVNHLKYHPKNSATGYGVRLLTELVFSLEK